MIDGCARVETRKDTAGGSVIVQLYNSSVGVRVLRGRGGGTCQSGGILQLWIRELMRDDVWIIGLAVPFVLVVGQVL